MRIESQPYQPKEERTGGERRGIGGGIESEHHKKISPLPLSSARFLVRPILSSFFRLSSLLLLLPPSSSLWQASFLSSPSFRKGERKETLDLPSRRANQEREGEEEAPPLPSPLYPPPPPSPATMNLNDAWLFTCAGSGASQDKRKLGRGGETCLLFIFFFAALLPWAKSCSSLLSTTKFR